MSETRMSVSWYISLRKTRATTSCKVLKTLYRILAEMGCPWSWACNPRPPLIKVASNKRPCLKLGGTTLNGREEGGQYYISQTRDLRSDLKEERSFFRGSVSTVLQLRVVPFYKFRSSWTFSTGTVRKEFLLFSDLNFRKRFLKW